MEQNTAEWEKWRLKGLGSSDAPVVMGVSPWKTRYQLWLEKLGLASSYRSNWAIERGTTLEPKARACLELLTDLSFPPKVVSHPEYEFLRASLDGYNEEKKIVLEIKCPGKDDHKLAKKGVVPEKYIPQIQHQLMVAQAECGYYFSFDGEGGHIVEVGNDKEYQERLIRNEIAFWNLIINKVPPQYDKSDYVYSKRVELARFVELSKSKKIIEEEIRRQEVVLLHDMAEANIFGLLNQCGTKVKRLKDRLKIVGG